MALDVVIRKESLSKNHVPQRIKRIDHYISKIEPKAESPFSNTIKSLGDFSDNWWRTLHFKRNIMRLMGVLSSRDPQDRFLRPVTMGSLRDYFEMTATVGTRLNLVVETWGDLVPFSPHLGAALAFCTSMIETERSFGHTIRFDQLYVSEAGKTELLVYVSGVKVVEGARALQPALSEIAGSMEGTVKMNGSSVSFTFQIGKESHLSIFAMHKLGIEP